MEVLDYHRSFTLYTSAVDGVEKNTCRTQILARCGLDDEESGASGSFYLGKACIGEHMYMEGGIAQEPTSEVCVVFAEGQTMLVKKFADHASDVVQISRLGEKTRLFDGRYAYGTDLHRPGADPYTYYKMHHVTRALAAACLSEEFGLYEAMREQSLVIGWCPQ